jgi:fumarate hydratase subunit alpha
MNFVVIMISQELEPLYDKFHKKCPWYKKAPYTVFQVVRTILLMSAIRMFKPSAGLQGIKDFIIETVETAGPNPCPPMVVGVGIGGTFDKAALLAKKALMRSIDSENPDPFYADLEKEMLEKINQLGIGPQGFGGMTTAIGLNIETLPTHIAGMPCAININCHVTRHKSEVI